MQSVTLKLSMEFMGWKYLIFFFLPFSLYIMANSKKLVCFIKVKLGDYYFIGLSQS
jgi:hypothetical protein